ncbi:MAG: hypothetical protein MJ246_02315 [Clostridia bacterium]|nr:hypothetical protein [Clostridia bacterium]
MVLVAILAIFIIALTLAGICSLDEGGASIFFIFDAIVIVLLLVVLFGYDSPKYSATDEIVSTEELKLADIETEDGEKCYVLRNSEGCYYFITEVEDQFGKGHSAYKESWIYGQDVLIVEEETDTDSACVILDEFKAKVSMKSLGLKPVKSYTFVVPKGTIKFTKQLPESK